MKNVSLVDQVELLEGQGYVQLFRDNDSGAHFIYRFAGRGKVKNHVANYEYVDDEDVSHVRPLDEEVGRKILQRIRDGENYSNVFIFYKTQKSLTDLIREKSDAEHRYTSTGIKFWRHQQQMLAYQSDDPNSIISTHISPEGTCNLKCPYCSVTYRDTHSRLDMDTIKDYVIKLKSRGLRAVILTGGGEPTAYKHFNELVRWLHDEQGLSVALITNGTLTRRVDDDVWKKFSWVRVSINVFGNWVKKISLPLDKIDRDRTVLGCSMVYTVEHEMSEDILSDRVGLLKKVSQVADQCGAQYIRMLPNCLLSQSDLIRQHRSLDHVLKQVADPRFFHQYKVHAAPQSSTCHQSYFRPYLSEEVHSATGKPGAVYPCDSVVLNDGYQHFAEEYQLCHASDILDYLDRNVKQRFDARERCTGCVFTENVNMLDDWKNDRIDRFAEFSEPLMHEEFV